MNYKFDSTTVMPLSRALKIEPRLNEALSKLISKRSAKSGRCEEAGELYAVGDFWDLYPTLPSRAPLVLIELPSSARDAIPELLESGLEIVTEVHDDDDGDGDDSAGPAGVSFSMYLTMSSNTDSLLIPSSLLPSYEIQGHRQVTLLVRTGELLWSRTMTENTIGSSEAFEDACDYVGSHPWSLKYQRTEPLCATRWILG